MNKEQENVDVLEEELIENEKSLLLINDDVNTFEYVIDTLMKVCHHTREQAETCAWITHYKGKCAIKHGSFEELKPFYDILLAYHLTVKITD
jgi:ATP-dependent Clp protease adaptor protein ClpS